MNESHLSALEAFRQAQAWWALRGYIDLPEILDVQPDSPGAARVYRDLERLARWTGLYAMLLKQLAPKVPAQGRILEVCCGSGAFSRVLASHFPQATVTALDANPQAYDPGNRHDAVRFAVGDARRLAYPDAHYDLCINLQSLHHFDPDQLVDVVAEACRVARGCFFFDLRRTWLGPWFVRLWRPLMSAEFVHDGVASHRRAYSLAELDFLLRRRAGLPVSLRRFTPFGLIVERWG